MIRAATLSLSLLLLTLTSCGGDSACDELAEICADCAEPTVKDICETRVEVGDVEICQFDLDHHIFEGCQQQGREPEAAPVSEHTEVVR